MNGIDIAAVNGVALGSLDSLLAQWLPDGKREGREWVARNPTRSDTHLGSFKINLSTGAWADFATSDKGGDVVSLYAYLEGVKQGEAAGRLAQMLGLKNSAVLPATERQSPPRAAVQAEAQETWTPLTPVPANAPPPPKAHPSHGQPSMTWIYRDRQGAVLCHVWRFNLKGKDGKPVLDEDGKQAKVFAPLTFCLNATTGQTAWRWQALASPRPLYNLDTLTANPQATVIICEGEKAADACSELFSECVTTTTLNGAQSPHKTDFSPLQGRIVWICPDHDEPGRKYVEHVIELLKGIAREVKCLHIPGDHPKRWDVADALIEGWQPSAGYELHDLLEPKQAETDAQEPLHQALERLQDLGERCKEDPGAPFAKRTLEDMWLLQSQDPEAWGRLREVLRQARVLGEVEKHLKKLVRPAVKPQQTS